MKKLLNDDTRSVNSQTTFKELVEIKNLLDLLRKKVESLEQSIQFQAELKDETILNSSSTSSFDALPKDDKNNTDKDWEEMQMEYSMEFQYEQLLDEFQINFKYMTRFVQVLHITKSKIAGGFALACVTAPKIKTIEDKEKLINAYDGYMTILIPAESSNSSADFDEWMKSFGKSIILWQHFLIDAGYTQALEHNLIVDNMHFFDKEFEGNFKEDINIKGKFCSQQVFIKKIDENTSKVIQIICVNFTDIKEYLNHLDMSAPQVFLDRRSFHMRKMYKELTLDRAINQILEPLPEVIDAKVSPQSPYIERIYTYLSRGFCPELDTKMLQSLTDEEKKKVTETYWNCFGPFNCIENNNEVSIFTFSIQRLMQMKQFFKVFPLDKDAKFVSYNPTTKMVELLMSDNSNTCMMKISDIEFVKRLKSTIYIDESLQERPKLEVVVSSAIDLLDPVDKMMEDFEAELSKWKKFSDKSLNDLDHWTKSTLFCTTLQHFWKIFGVFNQSLMFFAKGERIGNPFKERYSMLFRNFFEILYSSVGESLALYVLAASDFQKNINNHLITPIMSTIKDCRWLIMLMQEYPDVFKFTKEHYDMALKNEVARDNLYLIKKSLKQVE